MYIRDVSHFLWRVRVCRKQETDLRKVEKERGDTRTLRGQREREAEERGREGGGTPRALCDVKEHRFSGSRCRVFDIEMGRTCRLPSPGFADVGRFNPRTRSTWYQTRWHEEKEEVEEEEESPSSYFVDTLQRVVLQGIPKLCVPHFSFSTLPPPLSLKPTLSPSRRVATRLFRSRDRPRQILSTRYPLPTAIPAAAVNKKREASPEKEGK